MRRHLNSSIEEHGERIGVINFRKFFVWYSRGFSNVAPLRKGALSARTPEEMHRMIDRLMSERRS
jgi:tRNA-dihydrouridine synthase